MQHFSNTLIVTFDMERDKERKKGDTNAMMISCKDLVKSGNDTFFERMDVINSYIAEEAEILYEILIGVKTLRQVIAEYGGNMCEMKYRIRDAKKNVVDQNLSYEEALMYVDNSVGDGYIMEPMKEDDQK